MTNEEKCVVFLENGGYIIFDNVIEAEEFCEKHNITWIDNGGWI